MNDLLIDYSRLILGSVDCPWSVCRPPAFSRPPPPSSYLNHPLLVTFVLAASETAGSVSAWCTTENQGQKRNKNNNNTRMDSRAVYLCSPESPKQNLQTNCWSVVHLSPGPPPDGLMSTEKPIIQECTTHKKRSECHQSSGSRSFKTHCTRRMDWSRSKVSI